MAEVLYSYTHSTLEGHSGTVWALQQKEELLISGAHDKTVHVHVESACSYNVVQ